MAATCYTCRARPAGYRENPYSAFCRGCQPHDTAPQPSRTQHGCGACGAILATVTDFGRHQETYPQGHPLEGVFTGRCHDPAVLGLEQVNGVWGTPEGNVRRLENGVRGRALLAARRSGAH